jgi:hypothetical protein
MGRSNLTSVTLSDAKGLGLVGQLFARAEQSFPHPRYFVVLPGKDSSI